MAVACAVIPHVILIGAGTVGGVSGGVGSAGGTAVPVFGPSGTGVGGAGVGGIGRCAVSVGGNGVVSVGGYGSVGGGGSSALRKDDDSCRTTMMTALSQCDAIFQNLVVYNQCLLMRRNAVLEEYFGFNILYCFTRLNVVDYDCTASQGVCTKHFFV